jgi:hypothetical protein
LTRIEREEDIITKNELEEISGYQEIDFMKLMQESILRDRKVIRCRILNMKLVEVQENQNRKRHEMFYLKTDDRMFFSFC